MDPDQEILKEYQQEIRSMKAEIIQLNRQIAEAKLAEDEANESNEKVIDRDEIMKKQSLLRHCQTEIEELTGQLNKLRETNIELAESCEELNNRIDPLPISESQLEELREQIQALEKENEDLKRQNRELENTGIKEWEDLAPHASNEFFVNLQKKLTSLEQENAGLSAKYKKAEAETKKLKENCEKAAHRFKSNEDTRTKLKILEESLSKCIETEKELKDKIEEVEKQIVQKSSSTEGQDIRTLQSLISDLTEQIAQEKNQSIRLERQLQDKQQELRTVKITANQPVSKTSTKLTNDLELLSKVLADKLQQIRDKDKEIAEYTLKYEEAKSQLHGPVKA